MRKLARLSTVVSVVVVLLSVLLLLNITAPNPTGRRYSSEMPKLTGSTQEIGESGEMVMSKDLGLLRGDDTGQCICRTNFDSTKLPLNGCTNCALFAPISSEFRRPDFMTDSLIADSKNSRMLPLSSQLEDFAIAAIYADRPLWIYTRVNTQVDPNIYNLAESTGGGVVEYFTVPGYVDPVDELAKGGLLVGGITGGISLLILMWPKRTRRPPAAKWQPDDYPDIIERAKHKAQSTIDTEDSRHQL